MTLEVNSSSSIPESPKSCNSRFFQHLGTIGTAFLGLFLTSNPMRADATGSVDLSQRTVVQRAVPEISGETSTAQKESLDEEIDSDDDEIDTVPDCSDVDVGEVYDDYIDPSSQFDCGIIFTIYNPLEDAYSYLIGTHHRNQRAGDAVFGYGCMAAQNPFLRKIIGSCRQVYTEVGMEPSVQKTTDSLNLCYDQAIVQIAMQEKGWRQITTLDKKRISYELELGKQEAGKDISQRLPIKDSNTKNLYLSCLGNTNELDEQLIKEIENSKSGSLLEEQEIKDAWFLNGDIEILATGRNLDRNLTRYYKKIYTEREEDWIRQVLPALESSSSTCIAVGSLHLVGEDGLVAQLRKRGFIVEKSLFSTCANQLAAKEDPLL